MERRSFAGAFSSGNPLVRRAAYIRTGSRSDTLAEDTYDRYGRVLFCHSTPRSETDVFTRLTPEDQLTSIFESAGAAVVVCGHTHMQFDRTIGSTRVVNAGSVGMPFGEPGAYWLLLGREVQLRRTAYDLERAAERIQSTSYPGAAEFAANNVLRPPSASQMLEIFSRAALKTAG